MEDYEVTRAAFEVQKRERIAEEIEIDSIQTQLQRFRRLSIGMIIVSFVHMVTSLILFSGQEWYEKVAQGAMTLGVDYATWTAMGYIHYVKRKQRKVSRWVWCLLYFSLFIVATLNFSFLYANKPSPDILPSWMSFAIATAFAFFIPLCIGGSSFIHGELEEDLREQQQELAKKLLRKSKFVSPSESHNEGHPRILDASQLRYGNGKTNLLTNDVDGILQALARSGIRSFKTAAELGRCCGWSSPSSGTKALEILEDAKVVRRIDGVYEVLM